jgi:hypothetical protein
VLLLEPLVLAALDQTVPCADCHLDLDRSKQQSDRLVDGQRSHLGYMGFG